MAEQIKGKGVFWSVGTLNFTAGISSTSGTGHMTQSASIERTSEVARIKDTGGTVKTVVFSGGMKTLRISVVPSGSTIANAKTAASTWFPAAGTTVTVVDTDGAGIPTTPGESFNCLSATQNRTVDGQLTAELVLERGDESVDITTAAS